MIIHYGINRINGFDDTEEVPDEEWNDMTPAEQEEYLNALALLSIENHVNAWAYVEEGE